jgi:cytochrome c peroxidase
MIGEPATRGLLPVVLAAWVLGCADAGHEPSPGASDARRLLEALSPAELPPPPKDVTNRFADDPRAAALGKKFFFDTRFSGPLLDVSNNGDPGTLGVQGEPGKVACASCHVPSGGFLDTRSARGQISLASGWTHRRTPSLLDVGQIRFLNWDGRRDTMFSQPFTPIEDPIEFNSSRLFVAQQIARLYRAEYEAIFGPMPPLDAHEALAPEDAGCDELPVDVVHGLCVKPGHDDPDVTRVVVNMGKAIGAYLRKLTCGTSRFDAWMHGDAAALTHDERAGAELFVGKGGCHLCHAGPYLTDQRFHNVGLHPDFTFFVAPIYDPGASEGLAAMLDDPLNSKGPHSDGDDDRQASIPSDLDAAIGAFRTPGLRCVSRRRSFTHTGQIRSLEDAVIFFNEGGHDDGFPGTSENRPRGLTPEEREHLVAFLRALDGDGPDPALTSTPNLPPDPTP